MDDELKFSLSYEELLKAAEKEINNCDLQSGNKFWSKELADTIVRFWHILALRGQQEQSGLERVAADLLHLKALIKQKQEGEESV